MIPKVIHYCWFGKSEKPESVKKCIASWRKFCPDYKIIEWNEDNFDLNCIPFVRQAYQKKKWAFVTDYARLKIIYENGGIYFDTDVELLRNIDKLLSLKGFMGTEDGGFINTGLGFGAVKNHPMLKKLMEDYLSLSFPEDEQEIVKITCPILTTAKFEKYGYIRNNQIKTIKGITIFPEEYFCPMKCQTYEINITKKTYSIHHYDSSWKPTNHKKIRKIIRIISKILGRKKTLWLKEKLFLFFKKNSDNKMSTYQRRQYIKNILTNLGLLKIGKYINNFISIIKNYYSELESKKRRKGKKDKKYAKIKKLKNKYYGKRCFIICTGPSLTASDVDKLRNDITFSMNSINKIFDKTDWRPTFYSIIDNIVYDKLKDEIDFSIYKYVFISSNLKKDFNIDFSNIIEFPYLLNYRKKFNFLRFSDDVYSIVHEGYTVTYAILQIAAYMGFKEIYLLGCDCNYSEKNSHFSDYGLTITENPESKMIAAYKKAKEYADSHNIKIYNATRGGKLEVFERVDFDSLFPEDDKT